MQRVTDVIKGAGLMSVAFYDESSRDRGTAVHLACQYFDEGRLDESTVHDVVRPFLDRYVEFTTIVRPLITGVECVLQDDQFDVVGHCDRTMMIDNKPCVLDIKTGAFQPWHAIQLAGYAMMLPTFHARRALYLTPTNWKLHSFDDRDDYEVFRAAMTIAKTRRKWNLS